MVMSPKRDLSWLHLHPSTVEVDAIIMCGCSESWSFAEFPGNAAELLGERWGGSADVQKGAVQEFSPSRGNERGKKSHKESSQGGVMDAMKRVLLFQQRCFS